MTSTQRFRFWLVGLAVFVLVLYVLRSMLLPFVAGMVIAYFLDPLADRLELTQVHAEPSGDALFPDWERDAFVAATIEYHPADAENEHAFTFANYRRRG